MYVIKLQRKANFMDKFDEVIEIEKENKAHHTYIQYMNKPYYFGSFVRIVNGKEERIASFCNSQYAK